MSKTNKHGVFEEFERVVIVNQNKLRVEILVVEEAGSWYVGCEYQIGATEVGACGGGFYPAKSKYRKSFTSRDTAINHQLYEMEKDYPEINSATTNFRQPSLF